MKYVSGDLAGLNPAGLFRQQLDLSHLYGRTASPACRFTSSTDGAAERSTVGEAGDEIGGCGGERALELAPQLGLASSPCLSTEPSHDRADRRRGEKLVKLVLASTSATRRAMLTAAGVPHEAVAPHVDERAIEDDLHDIAPGTLAAVLAQKKALAVVAGAGTLVLGCDQVLETGDGEVLSKAASREQARVQLLALRGGSHRLISAAAIAQEGDVVWRAAETATLHMRDFSESFLDQYLDREFERIRHCVGGYRIEGEGAQLFERIEGSHHAILGLPLLPLLGYLRTRGVIAS